MTPKSKTSNGGSRAAVIDTPANPERERIFNAYRQWGYLEGDLDPLGFLRPRETPELEPKANTPAKPAPSTPAPSASRSIISTLPSAAAGSTSRWNPGPPKSQKKTSSAFSTCSPAPTSSSRSCSSAIWAASASRSKASPRSSRWSTKSSTTAAQRGAVELVMGMSHRGRLNVIAHVAQRPAAGNLCRIRRRRPAQRARLRRREISHGRDRRIHHAERRQSSHPSRLEPQPPRSRRSRHRRPHPRQAGPHRRRRPRKISPAPRPRRRRVRRTRHPRRDHELSPTFPATPSAARFTSSSTICSASPRATPKSIPSRFAACIARRQSIPIFHVNGEDVDAVVRVARMATEYRYKFGTDVVIDLIGYRRHGHSEVDDPTITQPLLYKKIKDHPPLWEIYADDIGADRRASARRCHQGRIRSRAEESRQHQAKARAARPARTTGTTIIGGLLQA